MSSSLDGSKAKSKLLEVLIPRESDTQAQPLPPGTHTGKGDFNEVSTVDFSPLLLIRPGRLIINSPELIVYIISIYLGQASER